MNNNVGKSLDMNNLGSLLGGLQDNKQKEDPNSKPKTYEEYKKEEKEKQKKEQYEKEYKAFKQSMQRVDEYLEKFDKAKLSKKKKQEIEELKRYVRGGGDIMEKLQNALITLDRLVDIIFSVALFGCLGAITVKQIQNDKKNMSIALKNKMGIPLKGTEKEMFNRYSQEKQQEEKKKQEEKDKKNKKIKNQDENQKETKNSKKSNVSSIQDNNNNNQNVNRQMQEKKQDDEKGTFFDNLLALAEEKKQLERHRKEEEGRQQKMGAEKRLKQEDILLKTPEDTPKSGKINKTSVDNVIDAKNTNNAHIDAEKILSKKQDRTIQASNGITDKLENVGKTSEDIIKTGEVSVGNIPKSDNLRHQDGLILSPEKMADDNKKMKFGIEQKQINNNAMLNNKQNNVGMAL